MTDEYLQEIKKMKFGIAFKLNEFVLIYPCGTVFNKKEFKKNVLNMLKKLPEEMSEENKK